MAQQPGWEIQRKLDSTAKQLDAAKQEIVELREEAIDRESFIQLLKERLEKATQLLKRFVPREMLRGIWAGRAAP